MRVADLVISSIIEAGTNTLFSLSGNQIMPLYDGALDQDINIIHARHESAAVFMADGYARASQHTGVALCTAGPGFTNALGALFPLKSSESPVLLITGDSPLKLDGQGAFQELEQTAISAPLVKESWRLTNESHINSAIHEAMRLARSGRHGPVHIAIPEDILTAPAQNPLFPPIIDEPHDPINQADLKAIIQALDGAERPLILTGATLAANRNSAMVETIQSRHHIPVIAMTASRGLADPLLGDIQTILTEADHVVLLDKKPDFILGFGARHIIPANHIVVCAADSAVVTRSNQVFFGNMVWGCVADPMASITAIAQAELKQRPETWLNAVKTRLSNRPPLPDINTANNTLGITAPIIMQHFCEAIDTSPPPLIICDGGEFGQWAQSGLPPAPDMAKHIFTNGAGGGIGGSIPQAIGIAIANPGRHVVAFMGDGSAGFHIAEIETARRANLPITFIVGNDYRWGAEAEIQARDYGDARVHSCALDAETRYDKIAEGFGAKAYYVSAASEIRTALDSALNARETSLINIIIDGIPAPKFTTHQDATHRDAKHQDD